MTRRTFPIVWTLEKKNNNGIDRDAEQHFFLLASVRQCKVQLVLTVNNTSALKPRLYSPYKQRPKNGLHHCEMINSINSGCAATTLLELVTVPPVHSAVKERKCGLPLHTAEGRSPAPLFHLTSDGSWPLVMSQRAQTTLPGHLQPGLIPPNNNFTWELKFQPFFIAGCKLMASSRGFCFMVMNSRVLYWSGSGCHATYSASTCSHPQDVHPCKLHAKAVGIGNKRKIRKKEFRMWDAYSDIVILWMQSFFCLS